jgi:ribosomal-protein-alanine N-acetyltransferase
LSLTIELRPMTLEFLEALVAGDRDLAASLLDVELPEGFPPEGGGTFFALFLGQMREDPLFREWCPHAVVLEGRMIGHAGYHGPPGVNVLQSADAIEIGYKIEPRFRGRGYATEAAAQLLQWADERGVHHFIASCAPDNKASLAIIRKLGFAETGEVMDEEDRLKLVFELSG